jgi:hypothetical protein
MLSEELCLEALIMNNPESRVQVVGFDQLFGYLARDTYLGARRD